MKERLRPPPNPDSTRLDRLIADLDGDEFAVREAASRELERMGRAAADAIQAALEGKPSLEVRRRLEKLQKGLEDGKRQPEQLRVVRAVEVLEYVGNAEAKALLAVLARGTPGSRLTNEAKASLGRLEKRKAAAL